MQRRKAFILFTLIVLVAALTRLLPLPENFSPIAAVCLFGAAHFAHRWQAIAIALAAVMFSDIALNNIIHAEYMDGFTVLYDGWMWQYAMYIITVVFGAWLFKNHITATRTLVGVLGASLLFFIGSNFGVWMSGTMYPMDLGGLVSCYAAGIPFLKGTVAGNLFFTVLLFGVYYAVSKSLPQLRPEHITYG